MLTSKSPEMIADYDEKQSKVEIGQHNGEKVLDSFIHQVSGRAHMLKYDDLTICKSLSIREWKFYSNISPLLHPFTPKFKGLIFVMLDPTSHFFKTSGMIISNKSTLNGLDHNKKVQRSILESVYEPRQKVKDKNNDEDYYLKDSASYQKVLFKGLERLQYKEDNNGFTSHPWTVDKDQEALTEAVGKNPWSLRQHRREVNRMLKGEHIRAQVDLKDLLLDFERMENSNENCFKSETGKKWKDHLKKVSEDADLLKAYLMLEDVTSDYNFPCILDLKVGTQLDRIGCSERKRDKHFNLAQRSSTGSLCLRLAGMQVYQVTTEQYLCRDKYFGRGLSSDGFIGIIQQFLHNGEEMLTELIPALLKRLNELKKTLVELKTYRFYAGSLLITYEGDNSLATKNSIKVYMIDFAHSTYGGFLNDQTIYQGPDSDFVHAVESLISILSDLKDVSN